MSEEVKDVVMSHIRREVMESTLSTGKRLDGRGFTDFRGIEIQRSVIKTAEGSAVAKVGDTTALAAVKFDVVSPFPDRPKLGAFMTNAELLPTASPTFEPGPPNENCIEAARVVDRAIRSAEIIDLESFYISEGKVLGLFLDFYVLNHSGNYTDAATIAATSALLDTQVPKVEDGMLIRGEYAGPLGVTALPVSVSMVKVKDRWLIDPTKDEENVAETELTIATTENHVCAMQKGKGALSKEELLGNIDIAFKTGDDIRRTLKG